jgi:heme oxygenase
LTLALPPNATDPRLLGYGLSAFAAIFFTFEDFWQELNDSLETDEKPLTGTHDAQVKMWLATLVPPELVRSSRLKEDLEFISNRTCTNVKRGLPAQREMLKQIPAEIRAKPHILLAYIWVMYMAIFSGGRWIRQQLSNAGMEYWTGEEPCIELDKHELQSLQLPGFSFLSFEGGEDGEDLKALLKGRLAEAETLLTQDERHDVICYAMGLFQRCIQLVYMIDRAVWWQEVWRKIPWGLLSIVGVALLLLLCWHDNFGYVH